MRTRLLTLLTAVFGLCALHLIGFPVQIAAAPAPAASAAPSAAPSAAEPAPSADPSADPAPAADPSADPAPAAEPSPSPTPVEGFASHIVAVEGFLSRGELQPGQWVLGETRYTRLQSPHHVQLDFAPFGYAEGFTMRLGPNTAAEDALVAAGVALATGCPSVYLVTSRKDLPWFLRDADQTYRGQVAILEGPDPLAALHGTLVSLKRGVSTTPRREPKTDAFIGCLMSHLDELRYAQSQAVLKRLTVALRDSLGERTSFCEGLKPRDDVGHDKPAEALLRDVTAVRNARRCVFYVGESAPRPSSMWVEAGVALSTGHPTVFITPTLDAMPPSLRRAWPTGNARVQVYGTPNELLDALEKDAEAVLRP
ncbi:MAG: hypothetical protein EB084_00725 [Proteobacteria bacterium]|nr:hypothetical protein [Pseudomonadota bacterium]